MTLLATTTVTVRRQTAGAVEQGGMVDPWDVADTDVHEPGTVVWTGSGAIVRPAPSSTWNGGVRQETGWRLIVDSAASVKIGDLVTADSVDYRVEAVMARPSPVGGSLGHVAADLVRVDGEA